MVDRDAGVFGAVWSAGAFCQQLSAGSVYLQFLLKYCERPRALVRCFSHTSSLRTFSILAIRPIPELGLR